MLSLQRAIATALLVVPTSWLIACASADPGPASGNSAFTGGSSSSSPGNSGAAQKATTPPSKPAASPQPSAATCAAKTTENACFDCCYGDGKATAAADKAIKDCTTTAAQKCGSACVAAFDGNSGTDIGEASAGDTGEDTDPSVPDPCTACAKDISACDDVYAKTCAADPSCAAADKCYADAKCADKGGDDAVATEDPGTSGSSGSSSGGTSSGSGG